MLIEISFIKLSLLLWNFVIHFFTDMITKKYNCFGCNITIWGSVFKAGNHKSPRRHLFHIQPPFFFASFFLLFLRTLFITLNLCQKGREKRSNYQPCLFKPVVRMLIKLPINKYSHTDTCINVISSELQHGMLICQTFGGLYNNINKIHF